MLIARAPDDPEGQASIAAFRRELEQSRWILGRNLDLDIRFLPRDSDEALEWVREIVAFNPDILVVNSSVYMRAVTRAGVAMPAVFVAIADPVGQGFVPRLARPGGTMTGFAAEEASIGTKWLELLKEIAPDTESCACIFNPQTSPAARVFIAPMLAVQRTVNIAPDEVRIASPEDVERVIAEAGRARRKGVIVMPDSYLYSLRDMIVASATRHGVPVLYYDGAFARGGGLLAFGVDRVDQFRRAASYVDQILNGARAGDLPVQMPTRFWLTVNLRTARALGLRPPEALLARADEVIE
jgi:putative ABC transport system substrate-binding protein